MRVIDFRLRPPAKGFLQTTMFKEIDRTAKMAAGVGMEAAPSFRQHSMPLLLEEMDRADIAVGVIPGRINSVLGSIPNDDIAGIVQEHPGRFVGLAGIDPMDRKAAIREVETRMAAGFRGIVLEPGLMTQPWYLDEARLYPLYAFLEDNGIPVLFMAGGNAGPDITYSAPEHIDRVARDFPQMKIISGHGNWPWVSEILHVCYRRQNVYLSPDVYIHGNMPGAGDYVNALNGFMATRFLYATAYPFLAVDTGLEAFLRLPIKDDVRERVLYQNAADLLGL